jgi:hypothetical protein
VVAPNLSGFGFSDALETKTFGYAFEHLAGVVFNSDGQAERPLT